MIWSFHVWVEEGPNLGCLQGLILALNRISKDLCFSMGSCSSNLSTISDSLVTAILVWDHIVLSSLALLFKLFRTKRFFRI